VAPAENNIPAARDVLPQLPWPINATFRISLV